MPIFRRKDCIHTASGIFALCKRLHRVESGLSTCVLCRRLQKAKIPDVVLNTIFPPEDGLVNARNMSRIIM
jgi:hypothetical protein